MPPFLQVSWIANNHFCDRGGSCSAVRIRSATHCPCSQYFDTGRFSFSSFLRDLIWVSIAWSILNCLPVYPMDGGQMMAAILGPKKQHNVHLISSIVAVIIGVAGYLYLGTILLPIFMALFAWQNWQSYQASSSQ